MRFKGSFQIGRPEESSNCPDNWFVLSHNHLTENQRLKRNYYGQWFAIKNGKKKVYRCLKLNPTLAKDKIILDWSARLILGVNNNSESYDLEIKSANWFEGLFFVGLKHIDPTIRMNTKLAILGLALGITSLFVALIGILI